VKELHMTEWQVVVIEGPRTTAHAFVFGFAAGSGVDPALLRFVEKDLEAARVSERLRALLHGGHSVVLAPASHAPTIATAVEATGDALGLRVTHRGGVASVTFGWHAQTPSRDAAAKIRAAFAELPAGATVTQVSEAETDSTAHGVELRDQRHEYSFTMTGRVTGAPDGVLAMHRRVTGLDFVRVEPLHLDERPL
jgi:hypothetical protein